MDRTVRTANRGCITRSGRCPWAALGASIAIDARNRTTNRSTREPALITAASLLWVGHATVLLELDGTRLVTDPVLRGRVAHLRRHAPAPQPLPPVDAVLLSHAHHDHFDAPSLRRMARTTPVVTAPAPSIARAVRRMGALDVRPLAVGATTTIGTVTVRAVRAVHEGRRWPTTERTDGDAVGFVITGSRTVWFAGDTELFAAMTDLAADVDVALVPIWGWGPSLGPGHMDPAQAAEAVARVRPRMAVPIHWGTFLPFGQRRREALLTEPGPAFARHVARIAPQVDVRVIAVNERLAF